MQGVWRLAEIDRSTSDPLLSLGFRFLEDNKVYSGRHRGPH